MSNRRDTDRFSYEAGFSDTSTRPRETLASFKEVEEILRTLAYAELRAVLLAWARVPTRDPIELVRSAIDRLLSGASSPTSATEVGARLREEIRSETAGLFQAAIRKAGPVPWQRTLAPGQLGEADGLEIIFHEAGETAAHVRAGDPRMLAGAVSLTDYLRARAGARERLARGTSPP